MTSARVAHLAPNEDHKVVVDMESRNTTRAAQPRPPASWPVASVKASAAHSPHVAANTLDNNLNTRWSAMGDGQWIQYDLGAPQMLEQVAIAWYQGNLRTTDFTIQVSMDGISWKEVYEGGSTGKTLGLETYSFTGTQVRYVRIAGYGNTENKWISITEVQFPISSPSGVQAGTPSLESPPEPPPSEPPPTGEVTLNMNFENGMMPQGTITDMQVKPKILTENGTTFLRITGSYGDNDSLPSRKFPHRVRATVAVTAHQSQMPMQTDANRRQFYSADIRFHTDNTGVFMELFQHGDRKGGYGTPDGTGPVAIFYRRNGRVYFRASYDNGTKMNNYDLGPTVNEAFQNYAVKAVWSDNPREGRIEVYVNGTRKRTITGRGTNLGPKSDRLPLLKFGLYGDHAVGSIDLSNVVVKSW